MTKTIDEVMRLWSRAVSARALYPSGHPSVAQAEEEAYPRLTAALSPGRPIGLVVTPDQLLCGRETLPSTAALDDTLLRVWRGRKIDRILLMPGLERKEMSAFLESLAACIDQPTRLQPTAHIRFEYLVTSKETVAGTVQNAVELVRGLFVDTTRRRTVDLDRARAIVGGIQDTLAAGAPAALPLAKLRSHDEYTWVHTVNVALLSLALARAAGLESRIVQDIAFAGVLHDVGKQEIPPEILNKPGRLTDEEHAQIRRHPVTGARILMRTPGIPDIAVVVAYEHHVRCDGGGYPSVPASWRPTVASRIVQIADVYDALSTSRPYRPALEPAKVESILLEDVGDHLDAGLLALFLERVVHPAVAVTG